MTEQNQSKGSRAEASSSGKEEEELPSIEEYEKVPKEIKKEPLHSNPYWNDDLIKTIGVADKNRNYIYVGKVILNYRTPQYATSYEGIILELGKYELINVQKRKGLFNSEKVWAQKRKKIWRISSEECIIDRNGIFYGFENPIKELKYTARIHPLPLEERLFEEMFGELEKRYKLKYEIKV